MIWEIIGRIAHVLETIVITIMVVAGIVLWRKIFHPKEESEEDTVEDKPEEEEKYY